MEPSSPAWSVDSFVLVASLTKLVTITAIMQLVQQGRMNLNSDMRELVPELAAMQILKGFDGDRPILEDNKTPITLW
jgi:CubicO group peptidase (beta-lactamase class C family)